MGFFKIIESRAGAEDIKFLTINRGFKTRYFFVFPDSLVAWKGEHL